MWGSGSGFGRLGIASSPVFVLRGFNPICQMKSRLLRLVQIHVVSGPPVTACVVAVCDCLAPPPWLTRWRKAHAVDGLAVHGVAAQEAHSRTAVVLRDHIPVLERVVGIASKRCFEYANSKGFRSIDMADNIACSAQDCAGPAADPSKRRDTTAYNLQS